LGDQKSFSHEKLRQAAAATVSALKSTKTKTVAVALDTLPHNSLSADMTVQAFTEGALLADYSYSELKENKSSGGGLETITIVSAQK
jgi:leucyl aminopeptidase